MPHPILLTSSARFIPMDKITRGFRAREWVNEHNVYLLTEYSTLRQCWMSFLRLQHRSYPQNF